MAILIDNPKWERRLLRKRRLAGAHHHDEVWNGVYIMSPLADDKHQKLVGGLTTVLNLTIGFPGLGEVRPGVNVSDRVRGWKHNYRVPDVAVRLNEGGARILKNHWVGGPDFVVEVVSERDRTREKLGFYAKIGTREVLIIDRDPWSLELYSQKSGQMIPSGVARPEAPMTLASTVLPLTFEIEADNPSPRIRVTHRPDGQSWRI